MAIPIIESKRVGVKFPDTGKDSASGVGVILGVADADALAVGVGLVVGFGVALAVGVGELPDGVETKAGASPA